MRILTKTGRRLGVERSRQWDFEGQSVLSPVQCRGFITYKSSDRTRFREHMEAEHDLKFDSDDILAISVMSARYVLKDL